MKTASLESTVKNFNFAQVFYGYKNQDYCL